MKKTNAIDQSVTVPSADIGFKSTFALGSYIWLAIWVQGVDKTYLRIYRYDSDWSNETLKHTYELDESVTTYTKLDPVIHYNVTFNNDSIEFLFPLSTTGTGIGRILSIGYQISTDIFSDNALNYAAFESDGDPVTADIDLQGITMVSRGAQSWLCAYCGSLADAPYTNVISIFEITAGWGPGYTETLAGSYTQPFGTSSYIYTLVFSGGNYYIRRFPDGGTFATLETITGMTGGSDLSFNTAQLWTDDDKFIAGWINNLWYKEDVSYSWKSVSVVSSSNPAPHWSLDTSNMFQIDRFTYSNKIIQFSPQGNLYILKISVSHSLLCAWDDYFIDTDKKVWKLELTTVEDINKCKIITEIQDAPTCEYESTNAPETNEYLMLYDDLDNLLFQGWWDRPQWDGEVSYHSNLKSPAIQDLLDSHIDEDWTATTETVIIKDILDTHCWFLTYDATSIAGSGTAINFQGKGLTVREALDRLAVQDLRGWYITPDLVVHFDTLTTDSGGHFFYGVELGTYKAKSMTLAQMLALDTNFDTFEEADGVTGHDDVVKIIDNNSGHLAGTTGLTYEDVWISMWFRAEQTNRTFSLIETWDNADAIIDRVYVHTDGKIYYADAAAATDELGTYVASTWFHIACHFVKNTPIVIYINDVLITTTKSTANSTTKAILLVNDTSNAGTYYFDAFYYGILETDARLSYHLVNNATSMNRAPVVDPLKYSKAEAYGPYVEGERLYAERFGEAGYNSIRLYASHVTTQTELETWLDNFLTKNNAEVTQYDFNTNGVGMLQVGEQANVLWYETPWSINTMTLMYMKRIEYDALADECESVITHDIFYFMTQNQAANDPDQQFQQETKAQLQDNIQNIEQQAYYLSEIHTAMNDPTGFENRTGSAFTITDGTRKVEVTVVAGSYNLWFSGAKHSIRATKEITFADTEGIHWIYFDDDDTLKEIISPTTAQILTLIRDKCLVTIFWWDATNNVSIIPTEERHGTIMDGMTHYYAHYAFGLMYISGFGVADFVIGDGSLDTHAQFSIAMGSVADEDIGVTGAAIAVGTGGSILYKDGASGNWRKTTQAGFWVKKSGSGTDRLYYNQYTGGAWQLTEIGEGNYVLCHLFLVSGKSEQVFAIMGENEYTTLPLARAGASTEIANITIAGLPTLEMRAAYTIIFQTDKDYGNTINARIVEIDASGDDYISWLTQPLPRGTVPVNQVSDVAFAASWDGVTTIAPSKNVIYDMVDTDVALSTNSDVKLASQKATKAYVDALHTGFAATTNAAQTMGNGANTEVVFEDEEYDDLAEYAIATGRFTASVTGRYHFDAAVLLADDANWHASETYNIGLAVDGAFVRYGTREEVQVSGTYFQHMQISCDIALTAGHYASILVFQQSGANIALINDGKWCFFTGHRIK